MWLTLRLLFLATLLTPAAGCIVAYEAPPARRAASPPRPPMGHVDVTLFHDALDPYGDWFWLEPYGWVWTPSAIPPGWRPYTSGRWVSTEVGWTWISDDEWGWAVCHYGRWTYHRRHGWVWVPGTVWAPAWVAWRFGDGWVGWGPLPPEVRWRAGIGLDLGSVDIDVVIEPPWWSFVEVRRFTEPRLYRYVVPSARNVTLTRVARHVTRYAGDEHRVINRSIEVDQVEAAIRRPIPRYKVADLTGREANRRERLEGQTVRIYRPELADAPVRGTPRRAVPRDSEDHSEPGQGPAARERTRNTTIPRTPRSAAAAERGGQLEREQQAAWRRLEAGEAEERARLEREHAEELRRSRESGAKEQVVKQQEEERKAFLEAWRREREALKERQKREKEKEKEGKNSQREKPKQKKRER